MELRKRNAHPLRGLAAGVAGGLLASWIMNRYQAAWSKAAEKLQEPRQQESGQKRESEDATMKAADRAARLALHRGLSKNEKKKAGPVVHYAFGAAMGGVYGLLAEYVPAARAGFGTAFGAALFVGADEFAVPALGLSGAPEEAPLSSHLYGLSAHLVYGAGTEAVRRVLAA